MNKKYLIDNKEFDSDVVMEMFAQVFEYVGNFILGLSDDDLLGNIYEEYDFSYTDLADFRLDILLDNGNITEEIKVKAQEMRNLSEKMFEVGVERSVSFIKKSPEWRRIFTLAEEIRKFLGITNTI